MHKAALYQRSNGLQRRDAKQVIDEFSSLFQWRLDGQDSLLDIGCGSGDVTIDYILPILPNKFKKLVGTDLSEQMIHYARNMYQHPKITFEIIDIGENDLLDIFNDDDHNNNNNKNKLDNEHENFVHNIQNKNNKNQNNTFKSNLNINKNNYNIINKYSQYFDHVTSFYCLHWVRNQLQAIKNIYNFLNSGGDCLLVFLANNPIFVIYEQLSKYKKWENYMKDVHKYLSPYQYSENPANEFASILSLAGFSEYTVEVRDKLFIYEGLDVLKKSVKAVNPFLDRIPYDLHDEFLDDYVNIVTKMKLTQIDVERDDFRFLTPYKLIIAYARKF